MTSVPRPGRFNRDWGSGFAPAQKGVECAPFMVDPFLADERAVCAGDRRQRVSLVMSNAT